MRWVLKDIHLRCVYQQLLMHRIIETKYFIYSKRVGLRREGFAGGGNYCPVCFRECDRILLLSCPSSLSLWFSLTTRWAHVMNVPSMMLWCFSSKQWIWSVLLNKGLLKFDVNTMTCLCLKCYLTMYQEGNEGFTSWIILKFLFLLFWGHFGPF